MTNDNLYSRQSRLAAYGVHRRAGRVKTSCICVVPDRIRAAREAGEELAILPECGYHALAAEFPDDHSIPWNCPTYWDGCNCDDPEFTDAA